MVTVVVLGATGMLGNMVYSVLKENSDINLVGTSRKSDRELLFFDVYKGFSGLWRKTSSINYVINCIGITKPYCHDNIQKEVENSIYVNSSFPHILNRWAEKKKFKVIQIATDCVFSGKKGLYKEDDVHDPLDVYGKTKSLGEVYSNNFLNIRCSIIGPEKFHKAFLLEWFLNQAAGNEINGYSHHKWNGVTTLQFARLCDSIIRSNKIEDLIKQSSIHHFVPNNIVTKYELLCLFNTVFQRKLKINEVSSQGVLVDRTLSSHYNTIDSFFGSSSMEKAIVELRDYIVGKDFYNV